MNAERRGLADLIESVADGDPIDWDSAVVADNPREQRMLRHLRLVAGVADVHRTAAVESTAVYPAEETAAISPEQWGHLQIVVKIGEGAFGEVYRARDTWLDREVALKLLKPGVAHRVSPTRIVQEARALARLKHPNIVTVHGADVHDGRVGLWMELVRGRTLSQIVTAQGPFSGREATVIGQDVCRALAAVHGAGIVHRDVKAQNVMRESGGRLVLMDFGAGGTPLYLSPEVLAGGEPTMAADVYAVGVLLFYLVTGRYPVTGTTVPELSAAHARGERRQLADQRADLPDEFAAVVHRALSPAPDDRYRTAGEMLQALALTSSSAGTATARAPVAPERRRGYPVLAYGVAAVVLLAVIVAAVWRVAAPPAAPPAPAMTLIAVLPLRSDQAGAQYLADGMTEALQQELAGIQTLRIVSRTSVDRARATTTTLPEIARLLNANAVLEGSVSQFEDRVRVNLRLIHAGSDTPVWARSFEESLEQVFALQARLAGAVAAELVAAVTPRAPRVRQPLDPEAYDAYLRGQFEFRRQTEIGVKAALTHFERATRIDPTYARPWAGMAACYRSLGNAFAALPERESGERAKAAATRALALDDTLAEAYAIRAGVLFEFDWDFEAAEGQYQRAIELDPSLVAPRLEYVNFLTSRGRFPEAFQQLAAARSVDPLSAVVADEAAAAHYYARDYERALDETRRAIPLDPNSMSPHVGRGRVLNAMGRYQDAIDQFERAARDSGSDHPFFQAEIAQAELALGRRESALRRIRQIEDQVRTPGARASPYMLALVYARLDRDTAFRWLEEEFQRHGGRVLWLLVDPRVDPLRNDPRFATYLRRLGLP